MRSVLRGALFLVPVLILLPHLGDFPFQPGSSFTDLVVSHYPNGIFLQRALLTWKTVPFWSPAILSGFPFGANPLSGLYYPPGWLAFLLPLPTGFHLVVILHLIWAGIGMYRLLRVEGLSEQAGLLGALAFESLPKLFSHLATGHITLIYAVAWTPWLLYAERRAAAQSRRWFYLPGAVLGMIVLADVRWAAYAGLFWLAYSLVRWLDTAHQGTGHGGRFLNLRGILQGWLAARLLTIVIAVLIAAPVLLPLVEYTRLTTRELLTAQENLVFSMPPGQIFGLVYPYVGGAAEWMLYSGAAILALVLYTLGRAPVRRRAAFWLMVLLAALIFSLGSYLPPLVLIARLPGMDLLRVPPRVLFLAGFCLAAAAAAGLDDLLDHVQRRSPPAPQPARDRSGLLVFASAAFVGLFAAAVWFVVDDGRKRLPFTWGAVFFVIGAAAILLARSRRLPATALVVLLVSITLVDLAGVNTLSLDFRSRETVFSEGSKAAAYLSERVDAGLFRIYSPSYSLPQHVAAQYNLELADGVDPLQLAAYVRFMEGASGVPSKGYSVTLPPFANGNLATDNQNYLPDAARLGLLNVKYIVSAFPLSEESLVLLAKFDQTYLYENQRALPRAWVQPDGAPPGEQIISMPKPLIRPNAISLTANGPGLLVLSELAYPGWQATIDNQPAPVETVGGLFRGVRLSAGEHAVRFLFRPATVYAGLALSSGTWVILLGTALSRKRTTRSSLEENAAHG